MRTCPCCDQPMPEPYCLGCGQPVKQAHTGRPRKWCDRPFCVALRRRQNLQKPIGNHLRVGP